MTRVGRHDKMLKTMFQKYIIYDMHNTTLWHTYHIMHTHTTLCTHTHTTLCRHNSHSESPRHTRFWHTTKLKMKLKISDPLLLATTTVHLYNFSNFKFKFSTSIHFFHPRDLHNCWKSNSLVSPVISSEYVQVLCAEMSSVVDHFLLATSWFVKRYPKLDIWISKFKNFLPTSFPCLVPQQATSCYLPVAWSLDVQHCNNECYSIVKEDCNGNMSFENAFRYALTHHIISGYPSKGLLLPPIARIGYCTSSSSSSKSKPATEVSSSSCNLKVKLAFT